MPLFGPNIKKMKEKGDLEGLIKELKNKDPKVRIKVVKALGELKYTKGLIEALKNDDPQVRVEAVLALADEAEAIEPVIDVLTTDKVEAVWQKAFEVLSKFGIEDERIWIHIAMELLKNKRYQNALMCFEKAIEINPDKEILYSIGAALVGYERYKDALKYFERVVESDPNDARGWEGQGLCLSHLNCGEEATSCCKKALEIDPKLKGARNTLSAIYREKGDYESLAFLAEETLQFTPEDIMAHVMLSEALASSNKLVEAESVLQKALDLLYQKEYVESEELSLVHQRLGIIYAMRGHKEKARDAFQKAIDTLPTDAWAQELLESYEILDIIGIATKGTPVDRRARLLRLAKKRAEGRKGQGISQTELVTVYLYRDESPIPDMNKDALLSSHIQGVLLKVWPSQYLSAAIKIASSEGIFEAFQKDLERRILE